MRAITHGAMHTSGGVAIGPRCRISVHMNVNWGPSMASTTSSIVISSGDRVSTYPPDFPCTECTRPARDSDCNCLARYGDETWCSSARRAADTGWAVAVSTTQQCNAHSTPPDNFTRPG